MASKSLTFDLFGRDVSASKSMKGVGNNAHAMGEKLRRVGQVIGIGIAAVGVAAVKFGIDSVKAYSEAAEKQNELAFAFKKFPALADTNQKALQKLNTELQNKTRFDDDDLAGAQAVLAQYKLTGAQVTKLTPLLADYAQKTGKDLPTAALDFGKAMLGQGRGLKAIGVNFKDTGTQAGNFAELVDLVSGKVGGFAEQAGSTAAGKLAIFQNKFGDLQEAVGEKLMPVLTALVDYGSAHVIPFLNDLSNVKDFDGFIKSLDSLKEGDSKFTGGPLDGDAWQHASEQMTQFFTGAKNYDPSGGNGPFDHVAWENGRDQIVQIVRDGIASQWQANVTGQSNIANGNAQWWLQMGNKAQAGWAVLVQKAQTGGSNLLLGFQTAWNKVTAANGRFWADLGAKFANGWAQIQGFFSGHPIRVNANIVWHNTSPPPLSPNGGGVRPLAAFASGGIVRARPGGLNAKIGEAGVDEAVVPLTSSNLAAIGGGGGGSTQIHIHVNGLVSGSAADVARGLASLLINGQKRGDIPKILLTS